MGTFLNFITSFEEVDACLPFFQKLEELSDGELCEIFPGNSQMLHKYHSAQDGLCFYSSLDPGNQSMLCKALAYEFFRVYRTHNFLRYVLCQTTCPFTPVAGTVDYYSQLDVEEKSRMIEASNAQAQINYII
jgi:hypothetical protein